MWRHFATGLLFFFLLAAGARAGDSVGQFQYLNLEQETVTIQVDGKDFTYRVARNARFYDDANRELRGGLKAVKSVFKERQAITYVLEQREGRDSLIEIRANRAKK